MKKLIIVLIVFSIICNVITLLLFSQIPFFTYKHITGNVFSGLMGLVVQGNSLIVSVDSPLNTTYNFSIGTPYTLDLNVSADFSVSSWWYTLYDARHGVTILENISFTPNTTFNAVRWNNILTVYANTSGGTEASTAVEFFVLINNSAPLFANISSPILVCEGAALSYIVNVTDVDEDALTLDISPKNPFFITPLITTEGIENSSAELFSGVLAKNRVGNHSVILSASDSQYIDTKRANITVIEINNAPSITPIGVQTVFTNGSNSTFYHQTWVTDIENGNTTSGNFTFNLTFLNGTSFFSIGASTGIMNVSPTSANVGVYSIRVCVADRNLSFIHPNISLCSQNGLALSACTNFSLTVTNDNRAPEIVSYLPLNTTLEVAGADELTFNVTTFDPDGTIPDVHWSVDGTFVETDSGNSLAVFSYNFGCGNFGTHNVSARATDGLLSDTQEWNVTQTLVACPTSSSSSGGGGGGGGGGGCTPKYACEEWSTCQSAVTSFDLEVIKDNDFGIIRDLCTTFSLDREVCGFQLRVCIDVNFCNQTTNKPSQIQQCSYSNAPSCIDGERNCHEGSCELLTDCGGPCGACATCSDGLQNQGEQDVDCSGPCPKVCVPERPFNILNIQYILIALILLLLIVIFRRLRRISQIRASHTQLQ